MASRVETLWAMWHYFNKRHFGGKLTPPAVIRITKATKYQGALVWRGTERQPHFKYGHQARIHISAHQTEEQMMGTLLHEMVHLYQFQVLKTPPDHDVIFRTYCKWIERRTKHKLR